MKDATVEVLEDRIIANLGAAANAPRVVIRPTYVKLRMGDHWLVVMAHGIRSVASVVGPDLEPAVQITVVSPPSSTRALCTI